MVVKATPEAARAVARVGKALLPHEGQAVLLVEVEEAAPHPGPVMLVEGLGGAGGAPRILSRARK
jgi:hypothetical protein